MSSKEYMRCVTAVDLHLLAETEPIFFSVKKLCGQGSGLLKRDIERHGKSQMERKMEAK